MDFSKAFDCISHDLMIIAKLETYDLSLSFFKHLSKINNFLFDRASAMH